MTDKGNEGRDSLENRGESSLQQEDAIDEVLREYGVIDPPEGGFEAFWARLRPHLEVDRIRDQETVQNLRRLRLAWIGTCVASVAILISLGLWAKALRKENTALKSASSNVARSTPGEIHLPGDYDPTVDLIIFRHDKVLAYEPAVIARDLRIFLGAFECFPSQLQSMAFLDGHVDMALRSHELPSAPPAGESQSRGSQEDFLYFQVNVFRTRGGVSQRTFTARVLTVPGTSVTLEGRIAGKADVKFSLSPQTPVRAVCPTVLDLAYVPFPGEQPYGVRAGLDLRMNQPACAGTFSSGEEEYVVYVSARRVGVIAGNIVSSAGMVRKATASQRASES